MQSGHDEVVRVLLRLEEEKATGTLEFRAQEVLTRIFVAGGVPVYAEAGVLGETLGHVLVREGVITGQQFAAVVRKMTDAIVDDESVRFGEVIVELGILSQSELDELLATQVERKIMGCVPRGDGEWSFDPSADVPATRHEAPIRALLADAAKLLPEKRVDELLSLGRETFPCLTRGVTRTASDYGLEHREVLVLDTLDGSRSMAEVLAAGEDRHALLAALVLGRSLVLLDTRQAQQAATPTEEGTVTGRRRALRTKLVAHHKAKETVEIISRDIEARPSMPPPKPSPKQVAVVAEDEFQSGRRLFLQGKFEAAAARLAVAVEHAPTVPLYRLWAELVDSRVKKKFEDPVGTKRLATQVAKEDAECAFAFYVLGYLALEDNQLDAAKRFFKHAFKLDHELVDAGRQARLLEMRGESALTVPTPLKEILPRRVAEAEAPAKAKPAPGNRRVVVLGAVLVAVVVLAVVTVVALGR